MLLYEVINGCSVVWQRLMSDYIWLYLCLTWGSAGSMAFLFLMDGDIWCYGWQKKRCHSARKPNTKRQVTPDLTEIFSKTGHNCILYFGRFVWPCDQKMCRCDILERSGRSCVERVTEGQSLFAFSVMSSLTVKGRKGLNRTGQTDWHLSL